VFREAMPAGGSVDAKMLSTEAREMIGAMALPADFIII
jgi:hypothetical protein